jgi:hypothetical protein
LPQSVISERLTKSPKTLANQGVLGKKGVNQNYDKSIIHLPRQGTNFLLKMLYLLGFEQYNIGF